MQQEKVEAAFQHLKGEGPKPALTKPLQPSTPEPFSQHSFDFIPFFGEHTSKIKFTHDPCGFGSVYGNMLKPNSSRLFARLSLALGLEEIYGPCSTPTHAHQEPIELADEHGMHPLHVTFVSDDYLKLSLHKYAAMDCDEDDLDEIDTSGAPDIFEFLGVRMETQEDSDWEDKNIDDGYGY